MVQVLDGTFHRLLLSGRALGRARRPGNEKRCPKKAGVHNPFGNRRFAFDEQPSPGALCAKRKPVVEGETNFQKTRWVPRVRGRGS